jgi:hypothetical protein
MHTYQWSLLCNHHQLIITIRTCRFDGQNPLWHGHAQIIDLGNFPTLSMDDPIPNAKYPSDHIPVKAVFRVKRELNRCVDVAREWWSVASGENDSYAGSPLGK